ncbi:MAG: hypothetical protein ACRENV_05565, partial [Candidatus Dormibacteria bacterium]
MVAKLAVMAPATSARATVVAAGPSTAEGMLTARRGSRRRAQPASLQPAPSARAEGILEEISSRSGASPQRVPPKSAAVWVRRTSSHCVSSASGRS